MPDQAMRFQIFLSYSRKDLDDAKQLKTALEAHGFHVWMDISEIEPGSPDWAQNIMNGLQHSCALVWLATPNTMQSTYVTEECRRAMTQGLRVFPVWIRGNDWLEAAWVGAGQMQSIDFRGDHYEASLGILIGQLESERAAKGALRFSYSELNETLHKSGAYIIIESSPGNYLYLLKAAYRDFGEFIRMVYEFVVEQYAPNTYGHEWILIECESTDKGHYAPYSIIAPWDIFQALEEGRPLSRVNANWAEQVQLSEMDTQKIWKIVDPLYVEEFIVGVACKDKNLLDGVLNDSKRFVSASYGEELIPSTRHVPEDFHHRAILFMSEEWRRRLRGTVFIEKQ